MLITPQSVLLLIRLFKFNNMKICHDISLKCWQQPMWIFLILSLSHWLISPEVTTVLGGFLFCFILFVILCLCIPTVVVYVYSLRLWLKEKKNILAQTSEGDKAYFDSQLWQGGPGSRSQSSWSHCACSWDAKNNEGWSDFLLSLQSWTDTSPWNGAARNDAGSDLLN